MPRCSRQDEGLPRLLRPNGHATQNRRKSPSSSSQQIAPISDYSTDASEISKRSGWIPGIQAPSSGGYSRRYPWDIPFPVYDKDAGRTDLTHTPPWLTSFAVWCCTDPEYPGGIADMAGYWAEETIFGVVRGEIFGPPPPRDLLRQGALEG